MADIKLKNKAGEEIIFNGISTVSVPKAVGEGYENFTEDGKAVLFVEQSLTDNEKSQARTNIDAVSAQYNSSDAGKILTVGNDGRVVLGSLMSARGVSF